MVAYLANPCSEEDIEEAVDNSAAVEDEARAIQEEEEETGVLAVVAAAAAPVVVPVPVLFVIVDDDTVAMTDKGDGPRYTLSSGLGLALRYPKKGMVIPSPPPVIGMFSLTRLNLVSTGADVKPGLPKTGCNFSCCS